MFSMQYRGDTLLLRDFFDPLVVGYPPAPEASIIGTAMWGEMGKAGSPEPDGSDKCLQSRLFL